MTHLDASQGMSERVHHLSVGDAAIKRSLNRRHTSLEYIACERLELRLPIGGGEGLALDEGRADRSEYVVYRVVIVDRRGKPGPGIINIQM